VDIGVVDLPERGMALLWVEVADMATWVSKSCFRGKYKDWYETNPASYSAWANYLEC